ncbi:Mu transposase C-terminal domain-containing protein [Vibrio sp. YMD68]|uniref:Mu transposase C-terminal domain-containing protein n=1 Tax=Vibrio sp. YMD68 TaxID=3042300 RepID=UPI00249A41D3|nr:Mu transposase C-terminal domain-containing protein [Vibrio sp. YMD68]WGV98839.1 Mu transposase C-terminal domain-containing protein [Vibrio sp. YMD68]WGW01234.1 Mu transposase C-terminal domain-containing protein [Vibrio sp. YMD68]
MTVLIQTSNTEISVNSELHNIVPERKVVAQNRYALVSKIETKMKEGLTEALAYHFVRREIMSGALGESVRKAVKALGRDGSFPSSSTVANWVKAYREGGIAALAPKHTGRRKKAQGWELRAQQLYLQTSKPSMAAVARKLREDENFTCTDRQVRHYLNNLPSINQHPNRLGRKLYNGSHAHYKPRTTNGIEVGDIYMADGHTMDVYLAHPETGDLWRAELIIWMDVRSRFIVGWELTDFESAANTFNSLVRTLTNHDHVPAVIYIDNGCGYKNRLVCDATAGLYARMDLSVLFAIPGNAKAKGQIERWFRTMEEDFSKMEFPRFYCGADQADEVRTRLVMEVKRANKQGKPSPLPTIFEWREKFEHWLTKYHNRPHPELKHTTPAAMFDSLRRTPVNTDLCELMKRQEKRKVARGMVRLHNRVYRHEALLAHNGQEVIVAFDWWNDEQVTIRTSEQVLVCDAPLIERAAVVSTSFMQDAKDKQLVGQTRRLQVKLGEIEARNRQALTHDEQLHHINELTIEGDYTLIEDDSQVQGDDDDLFALWMDEQ